MTLPAPFMRAIVRPACGLREIKRLSSFWSSGARRPRQARRPVDRPRAEPRHGVAQLVIDNGRGGGARGGFRCVRGERRRAALLLERRQRALPEGDLVDASPAKMRVHPSQDHRGAVLRLEREGALDPQHQRRGSGRRVRIALRGARRPLQLDWPSVTRKRLADNRRPIRDQACFAQAPRGHGLSDQPGGEFGQRLGAAPRALHHRFGAESEDTGHEVDGMSANVSALGSEAKRKKIVARTLAWWDRSRRTLAWRAEPGETPDPYRVWLSEVLLQQTTAQAATPYYQAFMAKWPRVEDLASAPLEAVMSAFAGLGYYSRARNLHACAKEVARRGGTFPSEEAELRALPGVGAYTAAAVAAIAFGRQTAPVDGNIARILARLLALEKPIARARGELAAAARALAPSRRAGDFAQALMDLGATLCRPRNPDCGACPLAYDCAAFRTGAPGAYPRRAEPKAKPRRQGAVFFACRSDGAFLARRRPPHGLLASTLELPGTLWTAEGPGEGVQGAAPVAAHWRRLPGGVEQVFTHFALRLTVYAAGFEGVAPAGCSWVAADRVVGAGFSTMMRKAVEHAVSYG
jgi:A/G-specific adenine glycosylase